MLGLVRSFLKDDDGLGTVEIVVIIAVLVGLALVFRKQLLSLVNQVFDRIFSDVGDATKNTVQDTNDKSITN